MTLAQTTRREILDRMAAGDFGPGQELPAEAELAEQLDVSRLTLREAIKSLAGSGVLLVKHGRRNQVAPVQQWDLMDPDLMALRGQLQGDSAELAVRLMEVRQMLETGAAELAATRSSDVALQALADHLAAMEDAAEAHDVEGSVAADLAFHQAVIDAAGNEFLAAAYRPLNEVLRQVRRKTSSTDIVRRQAIAWHREILAGLQAQDGIAAAEAMRGHMHQTLRALQEEA